MTRRHRVASAHLLFQMALLAVAGADADGDSVQLSAGPTSDRASCSSWDKAFNTSEISEIKHQAAVATVCPATIWNASGRQWVSPLNESGFLFGRSWFNSTGAGLWRPLNAYCKCPLNASSLFVNFSMHPSSLTYRPFLAFVNGLVGLNASESVAERNSSRASGEAAGAPVDMRNSSSTNDEGSVSGTNTSAAANATTRAIENSYSDVQCVNRSRAIQWCESLQNWSLVEACFCEDVFGAGSQSQTIVINTEIVVINNVTQVVQTADNSIQREINAFLTSFQSTGLLFNSNPGIGRFANTTLWVGFFVFLIFSISLEWISTRKRRGKMPLFVLTLQSALTTLGYLTMCFGHGRIYTNQVGFAQERNASAVSATLQYYFVAKVVQTPVVPPLFYVRYLTWILTTPALLYLLCHFVHGVPRCFPLLVATDVGMILCWMIAALLESNTLQANAKSYTLFVVGVLLFCALAAQLAWPIRRLALGLGRGQAYDRLAAFLIVSWSAYPILWLLGSRRLKVMSTDEEVCLFVLADVLSKLGFSCLFLYELRRLEARHRISRPLPHVPGLPAKTETSIVKRIRGADSNRPMAPGEGARLISASDATTTKSLGPKISRPHDTLDLETRQDAYTEMIPRYTRDAGARPEGQGLEGRPVELVTGAIRQGVNAEGHRAHHHDMIHGTLTASAKPNESLTDHVFPASFAGDPFLAGPPKWIQSTSQR